MTGHGALCSLTGGRACRWCRAALRPPVEEAWRPSLRARIGAVEAGVHPERYEPGQQQDRP